MVLRKSSALPALLSCLMAEGHKGNVGCAAGVGRVVIFSETLAGTELGARQFAVAVLSSPADYIQRCWLVVCRLSAAGLL